MFIEDWEEHFAILQDFAFDVLNIPKANFYLMFLNFCH